MARDPIGDLFAEPVKPAAPKQSGSGFLAIVLVCVLGFVLWSKYGPGPAPDPSPQPDDKKEQVDPAPGPAVDLKKCVLLVVRDKKTITEDVEYTVTMQDDEFWGSVKEKVADVEVLEDEDDLAKKFLENVTEKPPLVALVNSETRKVVWVMPLPKGGTEAIRSKLK